MLAQILEHVITPPVMLQAMQDLAGAGAEWAREREVQRAKIVADMRDQEARKGRLIELL